jgi:hypothetical protein
MRSVLGFLFVCATLVAADAAGKYEGGLSVTTPEGDRNLSAMVVIEQTGETLSVTAGPNAGEQAAASKVKLEGEKLTFELQPPNGGDPWVFDLKLEGKRLTGSVKMYKNGEAFNGKLDVSRP